MTRACMDSDDFRDPEGLRRLLDRLHRAGPDAWRHDWEAEDLMTYTIRKYGALARTHRQEPEDAAAAAFDVMRTRAARTAKDPWAVVTRAVQVTLIAEERADGLLCSPARARRPGVTAYHDAERFSDREALLTDYHPAFQVHPAQDTLADREPVTATDEPGTNAYVALDRAVVLFYVLGWPPDAARATIEYICARLIEAGTRPTAHEALRRDRHARALLDLDRPCWSTTLRIVLGSPNPAHADTAAGRGLLHRLAQGYQPIELLDDDNLVRAIGTTASRLNRSLSHA